MESKNKSQLAKTLGISRSSLYYQHLQEEKDWRLKTEIEEVLRIYPSYGYRRIALYLKRNHKSIQRVMQKYGIKAYRRRGRKKYSKNKSKVDYPNLLLENIPSYPNHIWATDFTYIWFKDRFIYLCTVLDIYTRKVVGLSISARHDRYLVISAILDSLRNHPRAEILHCDHGKEYTSRDYDSLLKDLNITRSMAGKGNPWENGYQESFYSQFKVDLGDPDRFKSLGEFTAEIYRLIYIYNTSRIHSALKMSPMKFAENYLLS